LRRSKFLDRGARFVKFRDAFAEAIKYGKRLPPPDPALDLDAAHHDIDGLRLAPVGEGAASGWWLEAQLKLRDPADEWRSWQYEDEGRYIARVWVPVYHFPPDAPELTMWRRAFFAALDDFANAKSFPGGRTRTTRQKLRLTRVPAFDANADLEPLIDLSAELAAIKARIAETDALIDQIVYRLYGLTAEEIAVVEGAS